MSASPLIGHALVIMVASAAYLLAVRSLDRAIKAFAAQSIMLAFVAVAAAPISEHPRHLWILAVLTLARGSPSPPRCSRRSRA
jgi:hypothetical protein